MKIYFKNHHSNAVNIFLNKWIDEKSPSFKLLFMQECEPLYLDHDDIDGSIMELERVGFSESVKRIFQGNHFYRSDTEKCPRCYRYRPELYWDTNNDVKTDVCDRCSGVLNNP